MDAHFSQGVAIVAGGSGGIGSAICLGLAKEGSDILLTYNANREAAEKVASEIRALGRRAEIAQLRLDDADAVASMVNQAAQRYGRIHSVVYAAGPSLHMSLISQLTPQAWANVISSDVNGCFNLVHAALPHLKGGGALLAVITSAVERVPARDICSAAPKAAIEMLMRGVAKEEGKNGIRANCVGPGWVDAGLGRQVMERELNAEQIDAIRRTIPLRRIGRAEEIADAAVFLLSSKATFITGQSLAVDGGMQV